MACKITVQALAVVLVALLSVPSVLASGWPQSGGPLSKTGMVPTGSLPSDVRLLWTKTATPSQATTMVVNSAGTRGFVGAATGALSCFELGSHTYLQRLHLLPSITQLWTFQGSGTITNAPALSTDESIIMFGSESYVYALSAADGTPVWDSPYSVGSYQGVTGDLTAYAGFLFVPTTAGSVLALNVTTGVLEATLPSRSQVKGAVSVDETTNTVYYGSQDTNLYAAQITMSPPSIMPTWVAEINYLVTTCPVVDVANQALLVTASSGQGGGGGALVRVSMDGKDVTTLALSTNVVDSSAVLVGPTQVVFGDSAGNIYSVNPNGTANQKPQWTASLPGGLGKMGLTDGTTVVFGSYDGTVAGFAGDNGAQKWSVSMGGSVSSSLSFSNNNVIAANTNGDVSNIMQAVPVWADIIVGVGIAFGVLIACFGYRFYVATLILLGVAGFFPIALMLVVHFSTFVQWEAALISFGAALVLAIILGCVRVLGPSYFIILFTLFTINNVLVAMSVFYQHLGLWLILIEFGSVILLLPVSLVKNLKKAASILGIAAVGATLVVDGVLWFLAPISSEYLAISYAAAFVLSIIIQAITGRGQRHLSAKAQREQKEEALTNLAAGSASGGMVGGGEYRRLSDAEAGVHPAADTRKNSEPAFAAGERFRGDEFDMGPAYQGPTSINSGSVAVLPGQRAMGSGGRAASAGSRQENKFVVTFRQGTLGMGLTVPHNPLDSPSCAVVKRVSRGGQAEAQGVRVGDFVVRVARNNTPASVPYDRVMSFLKPPVVQFPLQIEFLRLVNTRALDVDSGGEPEADSGGKLGGLLGGW